MSRNHVHTYRRPASQAEAWRLIESGDPAVRLLSGGTDLTIACPPEVTTLVDVRHAVGSTIRTGEDGSIDIEAMATLTAVAEHPALRSHVSGVMPDMLRHVGGPLLRNLCTIGGHLARGKLSDVIPVLLALDADVTVYTGGAERVALADYYESDLRAGPHLITTVHLPGLPAGSASFLRFSRTAFDFPIINVCCRVDGIGPEPTDVRVVAGATPLRGTRASRAEAILRGGGLSDQSISEAAAAARDEVPTRSGWVASAEYRSHLIGVLVERCLRRIASRLERG